jgi:PAS domain S-box-containing protein
LKLVALIFLLANGAYGVPCLADAKATTPIIVGVEEDYPPHAFRNERGQPTGFSIDLTRAVADVMGIPIEIRMGPWSEIREALAAGKIDAVAGMYYSEERSRTFAFSPPYTLTHHVAFARKGSPSISKEEELQGRSVIVMRGDIMHDYLLRKAITKDIVLVDTQADALRLLSSGKHDYALLAKLPGLYWVNKLHLANLVPTGPLLCPSEYCFAVNKNQSRLAGSFTEGLAILKQTSKYRELNDRWLGVYEPGSSWAYTLVKYLVPAAVSLGVLLGILVAWSTSLRRQVAAKTLQLQRELAERRQAERELQQSEERLKNILQNTSEIIYTLSPAGVFTYVSPAWPRLLGHDLSEVVGQSFVLFVHPDELSSCQALLEKVLSRDDPRPSVEFRVQHKNGEWHWYRSSGSCGKDQHGGQLCFIGVGENIDDRKQADNLLRRSHDELRASEEKYRAYINNSPTGVFVTDLTGRYVEVNASACRLLGYAQEELTQMSIPDVLVPEDVPSAMEAFQGILRDGSTVNAEYCFVRKGGSRFFMSVHAVKVREDRVIGFCVDVTERKRDEQSLRNYSEALQQVNEKLEKACHKADAASRAKSEFLANMSHEIRTPMTAILGFADVLIEEEDMDRAPPERIEAIQTIRRNGEHLLHLINDILDLSKIEAGKQVLDLQPSSPRQIVQEVIDTMKVRADAKGLPLLAEFDGDLPEMVQTDPLRVRQILVNLVGNAIKFTEVGRVRIVVKRDCSPHGSGLRFDIIDTGIGIAQEHLAMLFRPFSQVDGSARRRFGGTGLGLVISKRLAGMLGGDITVSSVVGKGTTFSVSISPEKLSGATPPQLPGKVGNHGPAVQGKSPKLDCRLLLAEDGPDNQRLIAFLLRKAGAEVTVVNDGQEAIGKIVMSEGGGCPFDVILMDMQMPVLDGYEATRRLRECGHDLPIIALTAHAMTEDRQKCLDAGCDDYLPKPVDRDALVQLVAKYAASRSEQAQQSG